MKNLFAQRCFECSVDGNKKVVKNVQTKSDKAVKNEVFFSQRKL